MQRDAKDHTGAWQLVLLTRYCESRDLRGHEPNMGIDEGSTFSHHSGEFATLQILEGLNEGKVGALSASLVYIAPYFLLFHLDLQR